MFRTYQTFLNRLLQLCDIASVIIAFFVAWYIKFVSGWVPHQQHLAFHTYFGAVIAATPVFFALNWLTGLYRPMRMKPLSIELIAIIRSSSLSILIFMSGLYFVKLSEFSRDVLIVFAIVYIGLLLSQRVGLRILLRLARARGYNQKFILLVGWTQATERFKEGLESHAWFGFRIMGFLSEKETHEEARFGVPCLGSVSTLPDVLKSHVVDHVLISVQANEKNTMLSNVLSYCEASGVQSFIVPDYLHLLPARPRFEMFGDMPLIDTRYVPLDDAVNAVIKRLFDIIFSVLVLVILFPVFIAIGMGVKLTSPGPIFYVQERVGKNRRLFPMYKFRSMYHNGHDSMSDDIKEDQGWTVPNDTRRTNFGAFLRRTSLDELPQFWNVLLGHMSVIGPRPERPTYVQQFSEEIPKYMVKHRVRPGITGWAQVNGWRGNTSILERVRHDIDYVEHWSVGMDVKIIFKTIKDGLINPNAY